MTYINMVQLLSLWDALTLPLANTYWRRSMREMWSSCSLKNASGESIQSRVLLADSQARCTWLSQKAWSMPVPSQATTSSDITVANYPNFLALCMIGVGYDQVIQEISRRMHTYTSSHKQIHQVNRVQANCLTANCQRGGVHSRNHSGPRYPTTTSHIWGLTLQS